MAGKRKDFLETYNELTQTRAAVVIEASVLLELSKPQKKKTDMQAIQTSIARLRYLTCRMVSLSEFIAKKWDEKGNPRCEAVTK